MLNGNIKEKAQVDLNEPKFLTAFAFLQRGDLGELPIGWIELDNGVRASVQSYLTMPDEALDFETHDRYYDLQYLIDGEERIGVAQRRDLVEKSEYSSADDITFYKTPEIAGAVVLQAGDYAIFTPKDAHKPHCIARKTQSVKKIVVKIPV